VAPIVLILVKELKLPIMPYLFVMVSMANLAGAATPILIYNLLSKKQ
jgi:Na+/H+ antiporter NhaD/arsenite permease-like protein